MKGTIKKKFEDKGFGFISVEGQEDDVFFFGGDCEDEFDGYAEMSEGDKVEFEITEGRKGEKAINVTVTESAAYESIEADEDADEDMLA